MARLLEWRIRLFGIGAVLGLGGIFLEAAWLVTVALVVLLVGIAVSYTPDRDPTEEEEDLGA